MQSRRSFGRLVLAGLPTSFLVAKSGVQLGVCTYSFRDLPHTADGDAVEPVLQALKACGAKQCELFSPQLEPADSRKNREGLRQWRLATPAEHFKAVRRKFDKAGVEILAYTLNFREDYTDDELDKCFAQTQALGVKIIATSTQLSVAPRLARYAEKYKIYVALHGHSSTKDPNEFSTPETFAKGLAMSKYFRVNLDIGHFSAAGFDPVAYITENHDKITHLHIKDRKKDNGPNAPFGEGDTPIKQVLALLKSKGYPIPAFVEYEYKGTGTSVEEVNKCLAYMKAAIA